MPLDESYQTDSGFFTDYEGTVTDAYFGTWEKSNDPSAIFLFLEMKTDSPDTPSYTERYSCGQGWTTEDGGETVRNDRGARKFHKRFSNYAKWIDAAVPLLVEAGVAEQFSARGPSTQASVWIGTRWQIEDHVEVFDRWDKENKRVMKDEKGQVVKGESHTNLPTAFLGFEDEGTGNGKVAANVDLSFIPDTLRDAITDAARKSPDREAYLNRLMLDVPEMTNVEGLLGKVSTNAVFETLKSA
jgi:hypothetical protein